MQGTKVFEADEVVEFFHEGLESSGGNQVVACCEAVAGIHADADAIMIFLGNQSY